VATQFPKWVFILLSVFAALFGMWHKQQLRAALSTRSQPHVMIGSWVCWVTHGTCYCSTAQKVIKFLCTHTCAHLRGYVSLTRSIFLHPWGPFTEMDGRVKLRPPDPNTCRTWPPLA